MYPNAIVHYHAIKMQLIVYSNTRYNNTSNNKSRASDHFSLRHNLSDLTKLNVVFLAVVKVIKHVMTSSTKAELLALYMNAQKAVSIYNTLYKLGHPQLLTLIQTDNTAVESIIDNNVKMKMSKIFDIQYHWLKDTAEQQQFHIHWKKGRDNKGDYTTKHHLPGIHIKEKQTWAFSQTVTYRFT